MEAKRYATAKTWKLAIKGATPKGIASVIRDLKHRLSARKTKLKDFHPKEAGRGQDHTFILSYSEHANQRAMDQWFRRSFNPTSWSWEMFPFDPEPVSQAPTKANSDNARKDSKPRCGSMNATNYNCLMQQIEADGICLLHGVVPDWAVKAFEQKLRTYTAQILSSKGHTCSPCSCSDLLGFSQAFVMQS